MYPKNGTLLWTQSQDFGTRIYRESIVNLSWTYREPILNLIMMHLSWICGESVVNLWWICRGHVPDANSFFQFEELNVWTSWKFVWNGSIWLDMAWYSRQNDSTDVAHLFCFQEIIKKLHRGPKKRPMTPKKFCLGVQKRGPWLGICPPPWDLGQKTRFPNGMAHKRSKVSVNKSQIGFFHTNFSRSRLSFMLNNYEDG